MDNLYCVMNEKQLERKVEINEVLRSTKPHVQPKYVLQRTLYEGYYDDVGEYVMTFRKEDLEKALSIIFGTKEIYII